MGYDEELKKKIIGEGFPLQRNCTWKLQKIGWQVDEEYPVLWISKPNVEGTSRTIRTSGDIRAEFQYTAKGFAVRLCISCKRQSEIEWAFMKATFSESHHRLLRLCGFPTPPPNKRKNGWEYSYDFETSSWPEQYPLCNIPTTLFDRKTNHKSIDDEKIIQTADNLYLEVKQTVKDDTIDFAYIDEIPFNQIIYIPIIVTGATLYSYDIDEENFDVANPSCINLKAVSYLVYQHRLPVDMQVWVGNPHVEEQMVFDRFNIFVVNYKEFDRFVKLVQNYFYNKQIQFPNRT